MTLKHVLYTMLCLIFWSTTASAAGYYLDIEETDDVRDPIGTLRLVCTGVDEREAEFRVGHNGMFIPQAGFYLRSNTNALGEPQIIEMWNDTTRYEIDLSQATANEIFDALNDILPRPDNAADEEWYKALKVYITFNSTLDPCQKTFFTAVANFINLTRAETPFESKLALMVLVNQLADVDINCYDANGAFEP